MDSSVKKYCNNNHRLKAPYLTGDVFALHRCDFWNNFWQAALPTYFFYFTAKFI